MSYQVLARKWRPKKFSELMGQGHVVQALSGSLAQGRLHHAFLFTGTRGVGKTTIARIIAKALNCEVGLSAEPCGVCSTCMDIDQGRYPDLLEIDAASRTKVDDTREILDNVLYAPSRGRFKVYLIDEVHMLSLSSFNALLKTLEEPPEHVKFILATTDPQKLPVTVLSRCLKFHLKRLTPGQIAQQMTHILQAENISADADAVDELSRAADGSMRDGLSLLDQAIAFGQGEVRAAPTREMLGTISRDSVIDLIEALAHNDADALIAKLAELNQFGGHHGQILARVTEAFHTLAFLQITSEAGRDALEPHPRLVAMAHLFDKAALQVNFQLAILAAKDVQMAPEPRLAFEMCMLRMLCFAPVDPQAIVHDKPKSASPPRHPREGGDPVQVSASSPNLRAPQAARFDATEAADSSAHPGSRLRGNDNKVTERAQDNSNVSNKRSVDFADDSALPRHPREGGDPVQVSPSPPASKARQSARFDGTEAAGSSAHLGSRLRGNDDKVIERTQGNDDMAIELAQGNDHKAIERLRGNDEVTTERAADFADDSALPRHPREGGDPAQVSAPPPASKAQQSARFDGTEAAGSSAHLGSRLRGNDVVTEAQSRWCEQALKLDLKGPPRELAHNLALADWQDDQLVLSLDSAHAGLASSANQQALQQAWQQLGQATRLVIDMRDGPATCQTPAQFELAAQRLRQKIFEASVREHPLVDALSRDFGAVIRPGSMVLH